VQVDAALEREVGQLRDRVDQAVRVRAGGADQRHRVLVDQRPHRVHVGHELVGDRGLAQLDAEVVRALVQRGVRGDGHDHVGVGDAALAAPLAVDEQRVHQALGAAAGEHAERAALTGAAGACSMSAAMAMISPSKRVALGYMSRCSTLAWL
jgi:hypothetical protein